MYFSFQWSTEKKLAKNSCFVNFPQVLLQFYVAILSKKFEFRNFFIILTFYLGKQCKIRDLSPIFFFAFFASSSLQRIFFAKIFFVCKDSSFAVQYRKDPTLLELIKKLSIKQPDPCTKLIEYQDFTTTTTARLMFFWKNNVSNFPTKPGKKSFLCFFPH